MFVMFEVHRGLILTDVGFKMCSFLWFWLAVWFI